MPGQFEGILHRRLSKSSPLHLAGNMLGLNLFFFFFSSTGGHSCACLIHAWQKLCYWVNFHHGSSVFYFSRVQNGSITLAIIETNTFIFLFRISLSSSFSFSFPQSPDFFCSSPLFLPLVLILVDYNIKGYLLSLIVFLELSLVFCFFVLLLFLTRVQLCSSGWSASGVPGLQAYATSGWFIP